VEARERLADLVTEDEPSPFLAFPRCAGSQPFVQLAGSVFAQSERYRLWENHSAPGARRLRLQELPLTIYALQCSLNRQRPGLQVNVAPAKPERFTLAVGGGQVYKDDRIVHPRVKEAVESRPPGASTALMAAMRETDGLFRGA
jgi:hypothetical protein